MRAHGCMASALGPHDLHWISMSTTVHDFTLATDYYASSYLYLAVSCQMAILRQREGYQLSEDRHWAWNHVSSTCVDYLKYLPSCLPPLSIFHIPCGKSVIIILDLWIQKIQKSSAVAVLVNSSISSHQPTRFNPAKWLVNTCNKNKYKERVLDNR